MRCFAIDLFGMLTGGGMPMIVIVFRPFGRIGVSCGRNCHVRDFGNSVLVAEILSAFFAMPILNIAFISTSCGFCLVLD